MRDEFKGDQIYNKAMEITRNHAQMIEDTIKRLIIENDCKPSDVRMTIKGNMHYEFHIKKHECVTEINFTTSFDNE